MRDDEILIFILLYKDFLMFLFIICLMLIILVCRVNKFVGFFFIGLLLVGIC